MTAYFARAQALLRALDLTLDELQHAFPHAHIGTMRALLETMGRELRHIEDEGTSAGLLLPLPRIEKERR